MGLDKDAEEMNNVIRKLNDENGRLRGGIALL